MRAAFARVGTVGLSPTPHGQEATGLGGHKFPQRNPDGRKLAL